MCEKTRVIVDLPNECVEALQKLAQSNGISMTEMLQRCVGTQKFLEEKVANGAIILAKEPAGYTNQLLF